QISRAHVHGRSVRRLTDLQPEAVDREHVRACGSLEIDIDASAELGHRLAVESPPAGPIVLELDFVVSESRSADDVSGARRPARVEDERVADAPWLSLLDGRHGPVEGVASVLVAQEQNLEADASVEMSPGGG